MPLCGAVTKLTRLSPNTDDCTLWTSTVATPTVSTCVGSGIDSGGEKNYEKLSVERDWRRYTQTPSSSVKSEEETGNSAGEEVGRDAKAEKGPGEMESGSSEELTMPGKGWKFAQA